MDVQTSGRYYEYCKGVSEAQKFLDEAASVVFDMKPEWSDKSKAFRYAYVKGLITKAEYDKVKRFGLV